MNADGADFCFIVNMIGSLALSLYLTEKKKSAFILKICVP
jgi:hypothetical protein